jgi:hypothetical protein
MVSNMNRNFLLVGLMTLAAVAVLAVFAFGRAKAPRMGSDANADLAAAIERINDKQDQLAQRLDRLESLYGMSGAGYRGTRPVASGIPGASNGSSPNNGSPISPGNEQAMAAKQRLDMEDRLISDPLAPQWAAGNEKVIGNFLSADNLAKQQLPVPKAFQAQCHSHLCRISMKFADDAQASQTQAMLLMEIAPGLPNAQTFLLPQPDGSVEMLIFAGDPAHIR